MKEAGKRSPIFMHVILMTLVFFYFECILRIYTSTGSPMPGLLFSFFFSLGYGTLTALIAGFLPPRRGRMLRHAILAVTAVLFLINYFVYKQFKVFYDLITMLAGAADALGQFQSSVWTLIFSMEGMSIILLMFLPVIALIAYADEIDPPLPSGNAGKVITACAAAVSLFMTIFGVRNNSTYGPVYTSEYSYEKAIDTFGLMTAMRLDAIRHIAGEADAGFEEPDAPREETPEETAPAEPTPTPEIVWKKNVMNIDFNALAESTSDSKLKQLDQYCASQKPSVQSEYTGMFKGKNLIMITAEAFALEVIDPVLTPTLYRMMTKGMQFMDYYQPAGAGTTGGEYEIIFGAMPTAGGNSFKNMTGKNNYMTMGSQLNRLGYNGWAFHNNSYTFYSRHKTHNSIGYSNGFMAMGNGMEKFVSKAWPESDLEMMEGTYPMFKDSQPFNIYYMTVSGHSNYGRGYNHMTKKNWDRVADLPYSDPVRSYIAANLELEDGLTSLITNLENDGIADDTVIVLSADHFPYGLDESPVGSGMLDELYGYKVTNMLQRDHNALLIWSGCLEKMDPIIVEEPVSSIDILPTLSNLFGTEFDSRMFIGRDVFSDAPALVFNSNYDWKTELGTYVNGKFTPKDEETVIPKGYVDSIKAIVRNKMTFSKLFNQTDYFKHVFGPKK